VEEPPAAPAAPDHRLRSLLSLILSSISLSLSIIVTILFIVAYLKYPKLVRRLSIQLAATICFVNIWFSMSAVLNELFLKPSWQCTFLAWLYAFSELFIVFLTCSIAVHLLFTFVLNRKSSNFHDLWYFIIPLLISGIITAIPLGSGQYGYSKTEDSCWFKYKGEKSSAIIWSMATYFGWLLLGVLFCGISVALVFWNVRKVLNEVKHTVGSGQSKPDGQKQGKMKMAYIATRIARYPAIPVITQLLNLVDEFIAHANGSSVEGLLFAAYMFASIQGLLYAIAFLLDHTFLKVVHAARVDLYEYHELNQSSGGWMVRVAYQLGVKDANAGAA